MASKIPRLQQNLSFRSKGGLRSHKFHVVAAAPIELVPYTPIQKKDTYDLRLIQPHTVAKTFYQRRDEGFLDLGGYLSGANAAECRCVETQPVVMTFRPDGMKTMQVYIVPREGQVEDGAPLPAPTTQGVELDAAGGELIAVIRFEGNATKEACERARDQLKKFLEQGT